MTQRLARVVERAANPGLLLVALPVVVGWATTWPAPSGLLWGAAAAVFCGVLPYIAYMRWPSRKVHTAVNVASIISAIALFTAVGSPRPVVAALVGLLGCLLGMIPLSLRWDSSFHAAVTASTIAIACCALHLGWAVVVVAALAGGAAMGWSRVRLRHHTTLQVVAGTLAGLVFGVVPFALVLHA